MIPDDHRVVGEIVGVFGIKGALKVEPRTDFPERFARGALLYLRGVPLRVLETSWHKGQARIRLTDITTPEQAESHRGQFLTVTADMAPKLDKDEYMTEDLIGCRVIDEKDGEIGLVDEVERSPLYDILKVGACDIPAIKAFVLKVDLDKEEIHVRLIPGMRGEE